MASPIAPQARSSFKIAIICALTIEAESVRAVFDICWEDEGKSYGKAAGDKNTYMTGVIGRHNVVMLLLPGMGSVPAAQAAASLGSSYPRIELVLIVGVCGVAPRNPVTGEEIVLGDVIVSTAVTQYDFGRTYPGVFQRNMSIQDSLRKAPKEIQGFINTLTMHQNLQKLRADLTRLVGSTNFQQRFQQGDSTAVYPSADQDNLYEASYLHQHRPPVKCDACHEGLDAVCSMPCDELGCEREKRVARQRLQHLKTPDKDSQLQGGPLVHLGGIGCANTVMKSGIDRDRLAKTEKLIAFEMEGAGVWDEHPTIIIKGACDYADSHKHKAWQPFAAMMAAGCLKVILAEWVEADELVDSKMPTSLGSCLASAPLLQPDHFIGRAAEIDDIYRILQPNDVVAKQRRVVLGGIGGVGKTQLAIAYAHRYERSYTSILWLNATSELSLYTGLRSITRGLIAADELEKLNDEQMLVRVHEWLAHVQNSQWLLIFDNYDEPDQFDLSKFCANVGHGSIVITTRRPDEVKGSPVPVRPFVTIDDSLDVLRVRSGRQNVERDIGARRLAERMAGLPLALVTAAAYLRKNTLSFQQYLNAYEQRWQVDRRRSSRLPDYANGTLYTTWNLSYSRLQKDDPEAAEMLQLLAYFDHQAIWYELVHIGLSVGSPEWLRVCSTEQVDFESVMGKLVEYRFLEVQAVAGFYSMHGCVHDWTLGELNREINAAMYWHAFDCVAASISQTQKTWDTQDIDVFLQNVLHARLTPHAVRLTHRYLETVGQDVAAARLDAAQKIAELLAQQTRLDAAVTMRSRALAGCEKALGSDHTSTLATISDLGNLFVSQDKLDEAEQMYVRALGGYEKALEPDHTLTLITVNNLGSLYRAQDKLDEAEQMYVRALGGYEKALGPDHTLTLTVVSNLGSLYLARDRLDEAERMYIRALAGYEKARGPYHISTLHKVNNLGSLYLTQNKLDEAERMYIRALAGHEKAQGPDHTDTLMLVNNLGNLYGDQGKLDKAEQMYVRALGGYEKALGPDHTSTLTTVNNLGDLYREQGKLEEAEPMLKRALAGYEKAQGPDHTDTLGAVNNLSILYCNRGKLDEAEQMYIRALTGYEKALGSDHTSTFRAVKNLGSLYCDQGKLDEAEKMYLRALAGYEQASQTSTIPALDTIHYLGLLYQDQGRLVEAEQSFQRAAQGRKQILGEGHASTVDTMDALRKLRVSIAQGEKRDEDMAVK